MKNTTAWTSAMRAFSQGVTADAEVFRDRVRLYLKTLFLIDIGFKVAGVIIVILPVARPVELSGPLVLRVGPFVISLVLGLAWMCAARLRPSTQILIVFESLGTLLVSLIYAYVTVDLPGSNGGPFLVLAVALAIVLRASLVPSPLVRTLVVSTLAMSIASVSIILTGTQLPVVLHFWLAAMGAAFVAVAGVGSHVIYGLRREVRAAQRLGQYELTRKIGEGGMGAVYQATHVLLKRPTAVKLLPIDKAGEQTVRRFEREVQQTSRLEHPNSIYVYDYGHTPHGQFYYAMEYLNGLNLDQLVGQYGSVNGARVVLILKQMAHALAEAHGLGLVHRDLKPANVMLCDRGGVPDTVKVLDFGLVKAPTEGEADPQMTQEGSVMGTPAYMAPETITSGVDRVGPPADVYAMGAIGYFLLTAQLVFPAASAHAMIARHLRDTPLRPSEVANRPIDTALENLVLRCLEKDPADRFADAGDFSIVCDSIVIDGWSTANARSWWAKHGLATTQPEPTEPAGLEMTGDGKRETGDGK